MKFGFSLQEHYDLPMEQVIDLLADVGFCALSPGWQRDRDLESIVRHAQSRNLILQSLHGPLRGMPAMWSSDPQPVLQDLLDAATDCAKYGFPILVVHPWNGVDYTFDRSNLCFTHFDELVEHAENLGITIAFENLEGPEYLAALLERYVNHKNVGFCWDSGHEACYAPGWDFLSPYGNRLIMTHLNDNLGVTDPSGRLQGTDDLHLLPFDGIVDWAAVADRLKALHFEGPLTFELKTASQPGRHDNDAYGRMAFADYAALAYQRASRVAALMQAS